MCVLTSSSKWTAQPAGTERPSVAYLHAPLADDDANLEQAAPPPSRVPSGDPRRPWPVFLLAEITGNTSSLVRFLRLRVCLDLDP
jgi:hypothetical protein